jgi:hypothetical protein
VKGGAEELKAAFGVGDVLPLVLATVFNRGGGLRNVYRSPCLTFAAVLER